MPDIYEELPVTPDWGYQPKRERPASVAVAANRRTRFVRYRGTTAPRTYPLTFTDRTTEEYRLLLDFEDTYKLHLPFWFHDIPSSEYWLCVFDSEVTWSVKSYDRYDMAVTIRQYAREEGSVTP